MLEGRFLLEDGLMIPPSASIRVRRLGLGLLLLAVPACGLSDYEVLMREAQEREKSFREEQKYLGKAVQIPTQKDEKGNDLPVASVYFRPPKGINPAKPKEQRGEMWPYPADASSDFNSVEIAFAPSDYKDADYSNFAARVLNSYPGAGQSGSSVQITPPWQTTPMTFERWEAGNSSINILRGSPKTIAIVFNCKRKENARTAINLSLQSLGVDQKAAPARQHYERTSAWKLQAQPGS
jgi:hypothetical protein